MKPNNITTKKKDFRYELKIAGGHIDCSLSGELSASGIQNLLSDSLRLSETTSLNKVLCDTTDVTIPLPHKFIGIALESMKISTSKGQKTAAIFANRKFFAMTKFLCIVFRTQSWKPFYLNQREEAVKWLLAA